MHLRYRPIRSCFLHFVRTLRGVSLVLAFTTACLIVASPSAKAQMAEDLPHHAETMSEFLERDVQDWAPLLLTDLAALLENQNGAILFVGVNQSGATDPWDRRDAAIAYANIHKLSACATRVNTMVEEDDISKLLSTFARLGSINPDARYDRMFLGFFSDWCGMPFLSDFVDRTRKVLVVPLNGDVNPVASKTCTRETMVNDWKVQQTLVDATDDESVVRTVFRTSSNPHHVSIEIVAGHNRLIKGGLQIWRSGKAGDVPEGAEIEVLRNGRDLTFEAPTRLDTDQGVVMETKLGMTATSGLMILRSGGVLQIKDPERSSEISLDPIVPVVAAIGDTQSVFAEQRAETGCRAEDDRAAE